MPSGKTHDRLTMDTAKLLFPASLVALIIRSPLTPEAIPISVLNASLLAVSCAIGGIWLSPDVDCKGYLKRRYGALRLLWMPYYKLCRMTGNYRVRGQGTHRSHLSHTPLLGSMTRFLYLCLPLLLLTLLGGVQPGAISYLLQAHPQAALAIAIGLEIGSVTHIVSDWIWSEFH